MSDEKKNPAPPAAATETTKPAPEAGFSYPDAGGSYLFDPVVGTLTCVSAGDQEGSNVQQ